MIVRLVPLNSTGFINLSKIEMLLFPRYRQNLDINVLTFTLILTLLLQWHINDEFTIVTEIFIVNCKSKKSLRKLQVTFYTERSHYILKFLNFSSQPIYYPEWTFLVIIHYLLTAAPTKSPWDITRETADYFLTLTFTRRCLVVCGYKMISFLIITHIFYLWKDILLQTLTPIKV